MKVFAILPFLALVAVQAAPTKTSDQVLDNRAEKDFQARWWSPTSTHGAPWGPHSPQASHPVPSSIPSSIPSHIAKGWGSGWGGKAGKGGDWRPWEGKRGKPKNEEWYEKHEWA